VEIRSTEENRMTDTSNDGHFDALWPRSPRLLKKKTLAPRLEMLAGKKIAFIWDYMFRGDEVFALLEEGLTARFPGVELVSWEAFGNTHGKNEREVLAALPARFEALGIDAVISGMAC
jgi:hypothetical protein